MNIILAVVDSLRASSLGAQNSALPSTPFFSRLARSTIRFSRAYATECWTLPTHMSMFTGLLPSEHGAHFQTMAYRGQTRTIAEILSDRGYHTEVATRNSVFDGSLPGVTRGFRVNTRVLSPLHGLNPLALALALSKPRFRRQIMSSGFFSALQRKNRDFVTEFARSTVPADDRLLNYALAAMEGWRRAGTRYFLFCNLYDVHAPYPPSRRSIFRAPWSARGACEAVTMPFVLPRLGGHQYLRDDFRMSDVNRRLLLGRYHRAIELMDEKLASFYDEAARRGLLDDTLLIVVSDHGEAFGEHGLYLHDASVFDTHLHVPLFIHHPNLPSEEVDDVVSTKDLFGLIETCSRSNKVSDTLLDASYRGRRPIALAEHFHYPNGAGTAPRFKQNLVAAVAGDQKVVVRSGHVYLYDLAQDPGEAFPERIPLGQFEAVCRARQVPDAAASVAMQHLRMAESRAA